MDELIGQLGGGLQVAKDALAEHPRFSQYKNAGRGLEEQAKRRKEALERQKENREERMRILRIGRESVDREEGEDGEHRRGYKYKGVLMTSEWLVDIPEETDSQWIALLSPVGKRILLVASQGLTTMYNKAGKIVRMMKTSLPGGNNRNPGASCMIDCIWDSLRSRLYCLDVLEYNGLEFLESEFDMRHYFLNSRIEENTKLKIVSKENCASISSVPSCICAKEDLTKLMEADVDFDVDGVLFYHPKVLYTAGQSPLVGWLKPWMLPEIISVPVPEKFASLAPSTAQAFIEKFNKEHKHKSQVKKDNSVMEAE